MIIHLNLPSSNYSTIKDSFLPLSALKPGDTFDPQSTIRVYDGDQIVDVDISGCVFVTHIRGDAYNAGTLSLDAPASNVFAQQQQSFDDALAKLRSRSRV